MALSSRVGRCLWGVDAARAAMSPAELICICLWQCRNHDERSMGGSCSLPCSRSHAIEDIESEVAWVIEDCALSSWVRRLLSARVTVVKGRWTHPRFGGAEIEPQPTVIGARR